MRSIYKPCKRPGCSNVTNGQYCADHIEYGKKHVSDKHIAHKANGTNKVTDKFYGTARWKKKRAWILSRDKGLCQSCKRKGLLRVARMVDHIIEIKDGGGKLEDSNLESMCLSCHASKTEKKRTDRLNHRGI